MSDTKNKTSVKQEDYNESLNLPLVNSETPTLNGGCLGWEADEGRGKLR